VAEVTRRDRSPIWIGLADLLLCVLSVVIVAVSPKANPHSGIEEKAEYLLSIEWDVGIDADADIWLIPPSKKPVFYGSRDVGCATLDRDNRGFQDSIITLADGSTTKVDSDKETIALRCIEPGHYDLGVHLYAYRSSEFNPAVRDDLGLKVHVEVLALNPTVRTVFARDVTLDKVWQTINAVSFDIARDGSVTMVDPPLEPITEEAYRGRTP
jgi:hypothetical protein